jgi:hypothetical protein
LSEPPINEPLDDFDYSGGTMMRIRIHCRNKPNGPWKVSFADVGQVPTVGDYVAPAPIYVYRVLLSLHILFDADYAAEVFAELVDFNEIQHQTLGRVVWDNGPAS